MSILTWNNQLVLGIESVDNQHKNLIDLTNQLDEAVAIGTDRDSIINIVNGLIDYTVYHFEHEEQLMMAANYNQELYAVHEAEHQEFVAKMLDVQREVHVNIDSITADLMDYVINWLYHHILNTDKQMALSLIKGIDAAEIYFEKQSPNDIMQSNLYSALRESENRFKELAENISALIWITNASHVPIFCNHFWLETFNIPFEKITREKWLNVIHPKDRDKVTETYRRAADERTSFKIEYRLLNADGKITWIYETAVPRLRNNGSFAGLMGCGMDITMQKQAETMLAHNNSLLEEKIEQRTAQLKSTLTQLDSANKSLEKQYTDTVIAFAKIIELRPGIKSGQSKYIAEKAVLVARELGMSTEEKKNVLYAGLLIQIGKMSLPDSLLEEPFYSMSPENKRCYLRHAVEGEALLNGLTQLKGASLLIRHQYEHYDGTGFPDGLAKDKIPLGARILNVVSDYILCLDGSITGEVMPVSAVLSRLMVRKENCYDPDVVDAFIKVLKETTEQVELPTVGKSWKTSWTVTELKNVSVARPVIEILWTQLRPGMDVESVYFDNKPYIRNCIVDQRMIRTIAQLRDNTGKNPIVKIRLGAD